MNILIVDDDQISQCLVQDLLVEHGYQVFIANNGLEALEILKENPIRLVISDWEMPLMNGPDLCRQIRSQFEAYIYVLILTSHQHHAKLLEGLSQGADDFMSKPFDPKELIVRLQTGERIMSLETRDVAIFAMAKLAESRDFETGMHLERVQNYCRIIAEYLHEHGLFPEEINNDFVRLIFKTSPLHDIGKVGIPDSILLKPSRLTDREFEIMKAHTTIGAETIDAALLKFPGTPFLQMARDIIAGHHERYDGQGYPGGLKADEIPLSGRIVALADVYDALVSRRVYKKAFSHEVALGIIREEVGTQFDPVIIEAFEQRLEAFAAVSAEVQNKEDPLLISK